MSRGIAVRGSLLARILGALVVVLGVSVAATAVLDLRLTRSAVAEQAAQVATGNLTVLREAFARRESDLVVRLRSLAAALAAEGLTAPERRADLIARLGGAVAPLQLDLLEVVDHEGVALDPPVAVGSVGALLPAEGSLTLEPTSRLVRSSGGRFVQAVPVPIGGGARPLVLVGGLEFGDDLAFQLRNQLGGLTDVVLVASDQLAGSTLAEPVDLPPGTDEPGDELPEMPTAARVGDVDSLVAYAPVGQAAGEGLGGALGIVLFDPGTRLNDTLAGNRLAVLGALAALALGLGWLLFRALVRPVVALAATAERIAAGELHVPFSAGGHDEIAQLGHSLERMRTEIGTKIALIERQAGELRELSARVVAAQDQERQRLARDLHDGIQQQLVLLRVRVGLAEEAAARGTREQLDDLGQELDATIQRLREVSQDLYPSILRDRGLVPALRSQAGRLPLTTELACEPDDFPRLPPELESGAFFLLSEALTNVLKHADASTIAVSVRIDGGELALSVADDGRGFDPSAFGRRRGLAHLEDRARALGGSLRIDSAPGRGTTVVAAIPVPEPPVADHPAPSPAEPVPRG